MMNRGFRIQTAKCFHRFQPPDPVHRSLGKSNNSRKRRSLIPENIRRTGQRQTKRHPPAPAAAKTRAIAIQYLSAFVFYPQIRLSRLACTGGRRKKNSLSSPANERRMQQQTVILQQERFQADHKGCGNDSYRIPSPAHNRNRLSHLNLPAR